MSPLRWLARTRRRLVVTALLALAVLFGAAGPLATWVRDQSTSVSTDMLILTVWLLVLLLGAACLAILAGDMIFPYRWRERVILSLDVPLPEAENDLLPPPIPQTHGLGFSMIFVGLVLAGALGIEATTQGFFEEYQRVGAKRTILRGDNTELKVQLLQELADRRREQLSRDALYLLDLSWRDEHQPPEVRNAALVSLGRLGQALVSSVRSWVSEGVTDTWELELLRRLRRQIAPNLLVAIEDADAEQARHMLLVLGKLRDDASVEPLIAIAQAGAQSPDRGWAGVVTALGLLQDTRALLPLVRLAPATVTSPHFRELSWAVGEISRHYAPGSEEDVDAAFEEFVETYSGLVAAESLERRCDAVYVTRTTGDARISPALFELFDSPAAKGNCEAAYIDVDGLAPELMAASEPLQLRILKSLAVVAVGNEEVLSWLRARKDNMAYGEFIHGQILETLKLVQAVEDREE